VTDADPLFDLLRPGERAAARHKRKVADALKADASDLLVTEDIVTSDGGRTVQVRVRLLEIPRFVYDYHDFVQVGIGDAPPDEVVGDENPQEGPGGKGAGESGGRGYTVEMSMDDLIELLMDAWGLPNLEPKKRSEIVTEDYQLTDISRKGPASRIHKKRTLKNAIKRAIAQGGEVVVHNDDLRYRSPKTTYSASSNAAIVLVRDRSGSMGTFEMKVSRMMSVWLVQFLRRRYQQVALRFVLHDHAAEEVDEHTFYHVTAGGGTQIAEAYRFAQQILTDYPDAEWSRYVTHFSDGDDWDHATSVEEIKQMLPSLAAFFYCEIGEGEDENSDVWMAQNELEDSPNFVRYAISEESDVPDALKAFLVVDEP